jgi:PAS domain S-box-containing protein
MLQAITEGKPAETAIIDSQIQLRLRLNNAQHGLWDWDVTSGHISIDATWHAILGYQPGELDLQIETWAATVHPDDRDRLMAIRNRHLESDDHLYNVDYRARHKSGRWVWVNSRGRVQSRDADGKPLRMMGTIHDITERKRIETQLRESEERFRLLVDNLPLIIWLIDASGTTTFLNRFGTEFTGFSEAETCRFGWQAAIHPDDLPGMQAQFVPAFAAHQPLQTEFRVRRHDGQYRWLLDSCRPRFAADGTFVGYIGCGLDITDRKTMLAQMEQATQLEGLGRLAGGITHDFNNVLTAIAGYAELAQFEVAPGSNVALYLQNVLTSTQSAAKLMKQLLTYARRQVVELGVVNLNDVIVQLEPLLPRMISEAYELKFVLYENIWCVQANASQMEQVLLNLIVNAQDAMPDGGRILIETANVTLDAENAAQHIDLTPGEYVMFTVSDHGIGMAPDVKEHIFEPFFTTKPTGQGVGLGLATCYGIVKQSKGHISVYSGPKQGTTFKVYLPRYMEMSIGPESKQKKDLPAGSATILLVDDEPLVRDIAARILRRQSYNVLEAGSGFEALNVQSQWAGSIDLLVTDVVMPLMSGKTLAQRLLAICPDLKVIYMSGYTQNVMSQQELLVPGVALINKPFSSSVLLQAVHAILQTPGMEI